MKVLRDKIEGLQIKVLTDKDIEKLLNYFVKSRVFIDSKTIDQ